jgi:molybdate transport system permease protein
LFHVLTPEELSALWVSVTVATAAVVFSLPLGIALGWLLARRDFLGKTLLETIVNLPLVLPPVVTGYLLLVLLGRQGLLGGFLESTFGVRFVFDWKGAALASAVVSFPLMVRAIRMAFASVDVRLEQAARSLGAGPFDTFWSVSLPLARRGIIAGCVLAFARSMGEFGATIMIAANIPGETRTIPLFIYNQLETPGGLEASGRIVLVSVLVAAGALAVGEWLERRGQAKLESH